jgi:CHAT domain-containing protein
VFSQGTDCLFFGLGDPDFRGNSKAPKDTNAYFSDGKARLEELRKLARLPGTRTEIETLARTLGGGPEDVLLGSDASEAKLTTRPASRELNRYAILAFATHGLVTGNLANTLAEPALALTPPLAAGGLDDGLLTASEASLLRLNAEWVLLSACNSAAGGSADAEGLTGLARAFLLAGARAVLVSHWRVRMTWRRRSLADNCFDAQCWPNEGKSPPTGYARTNDESKVGRNCVPFCDAISMGCFRTSRH